MAAFAIALGFLVRPSPVRTAKNCWFGIPSTKIFGERASQVVPIKLHDCTQKKKKEKENKERLTHSGGYSCNWLRNKVRDNLSWNAFGFGCRFMMRGIPLRSIIAHSYLHSQCSMVAPKWTTQRQRPRHLHIHSHTGLWAAGERYKWPAPLTHFAPTISYIFHLSVTGAPFVFTSYTFLN